MRIKDSYQTGADEIISVLMSYADDSQAAISAKFFKTGKGQYAEGDRFLGIKNPAVRMVVKNTGTISLGEIGHLISSEWHEIRLCGFLLLVKEYESLSKPKNANDPDAIKRRDEMVRFYLSNARQANNWDLVDLTVYKILGRWLIQPTLMGSQDNIARMNVDYKISVLDRLSSSNCLWEQRMSMVSSWMPTHEKDPSWCLRYSSEHLEHKHDLMHKAVGWMLREMGKHCGMDILRSYLDDNVHRMSRTTLRYAIELMDRDERLYWMNK